MSAIDLLDAAREVQDFCDQQGWGSCFIGGIAVQRWSQARVTRDVDLTLLTGFGGEVPFIETLLAHYNPRNTSPAQFALRSRVLLLNSPSGIGIDVSLGGLPFEHLVIQRATLFEFVPGLELRTCSAEDLMVMKLFASRAIDIRDAEGIAVRQRTLDWHYVKEHLTPLAEAKEDPEILRHLARIRRLGTTL
ncbi:MAG: nucleotidyl transferase AbiEii/AbiGii toxin family protein [Candidatus Solibacter sp.]